MSYGIKPSSKRKRDGFNKKLNDRARAKASKSGHEVFNHCDTCGLSNRVKRLAGFLVQLHDSVDDAPVWRCLKCCGRFGFRKRRILKGDPWSRYGERPIDAFSLRIRRLMVKTAKRHHLPKMKIFRMSITLFRHKLLWPEANAYRSLKHLFTWRFELNWHRFESLTKYRRHGRKVETIDNKALEPLDGKAIGDFLCGMREHDPNKD